MGSDCWKSSQTIILKLPSYVQRLLLNNKERYGTRITILRVLYHLWNVPKTDLQRQVLLKN